MQGNTVQEATPVRHRLALGQWQPGRVSFLPVGKVGAGISWVSAQLVLSQGWVGAPRGLGRRLGVGLGGYRFPGGFPERKWEGLGGQDPSLRL